MRQMEIIDFLFYKFYHMNTWWEQVRVRNLITNILPPSYWTYRVASLGSFPNISLNCPLSWLWPRFLQTITRLLKKVGTNKKLLPLIEMKILTGTWDQSSEKSNKEHFQWMHWMKGHCIMNLISINWILFIGQCHIDDTKDYHKNQT